jgi:hypothetical protein
MKFDYCNFEDGPDESLLIYIGSSFIDEPEELYVIELAALKNGKVLSMKLLFNGMDCKYSFKAEEKALIQTYVQETLPDTPYNQWFVQGISL